MSQSPLFGLPSDIAVAGPYLVVLDMASDSVVHILRAATGEHLVQLGRRGEGPGEFKTAWTLASDTGDSDLVWVYDIGLLRLTEVDVASSVREKRLICTRIITLRTDAVPTGPIWLDQNRLVSLGFFPTGRLGYFDFEGNFVEAAGPIPAGEGEMDAGIRQHVFQATLTTNVSRNLLVAATRHASQLEIYRPNAERVAFVAGPLEVRPEYGVSRSVRGLSMQTGADLRFGYVDVAADADRIFALFSGRTREGFPKSAFQGRFIHIFDWDGQFKSALTLDTEIVGITVLSGTGEMLAIRHDPTPAIIRFPLTAGTQ